MAEQRRVSKNLLGAFVTMSGGHFDSGCFRISQFADELQHEIAINDRRDGRGFDDDTLEKLDAIQQHIETAGRLAKEVEWLYSDDIGPETFIDQANKILGETDPTLARSGGRGGSVDDDWSELGPVG